MSLSTVKPNDVIIITDSIVIIVIAVIIDIRCPPLATAKPNDAEEDQGVHFYIMRFDTNSIYCHIVVSACHFCHACHTSQKVTPSCLSRSAFKATRLDAEAVNIVHQTIDLGESVG